MLATKRPMTRPTKKHRTVMAKLSLIAQEVLAKHKAVKLNNPHNDTGFDFEYELETPVGQLWIKIADKPEYERTNTRCSFTIFQRFEDVERALKVFSRHDINPYSGKWNFLFGSNDEELMADDCLNYWALSIDGLMEHEVVPAPTPRYEIVFNGEVIINRHKSSQESEKWLKDVLEFIPKAERNDRHLTTNREDYIIQKMPNPGAKHVYGYSLTE